MKTPTEFLLLLILGIGALQKLTTHLSGQHAGPLCWARRLSELRSEMVPELPEKHKLVSKGRYNCLRGPAAARPGSPFVSTGPFLVSADWLSTGDLIRRALSPTESGGRAGSTAGWGSGEVCLVAAGCVGRSRKYPGDFREQRFGWKSKCSCIYIWNRGKKSGISYPLKYSHLENLMDRGAWQATVLGVEKSRV